MKSETCLIKGWKDIVRKLDFCNSSITLHERGKRSKACFGWFHFYSFVYWYKYVRSDLWQCML